MTTTIDYSSLDERRKEVCNVVEVVVHLDGIDSAGEEFCRDCVFFAPATHYDAANVLEEAGRGLIEPVIAPDIRWDPEATYTAITVEERNRQKGNLRTVIDGAKLGGNGVAARDIPALFIEIG